MFMSQAAHIAERRQQMLAKVAELDLVAVQAAHASYMAAIDTEEEAEKGRTYQRMARSLRQSLALHERFERADTRAAREAREDARRESILGPARWSRPEPTRRDTPAARARADDLRTAVHRVIWSEGERPDCETDYDVEGELIRWLEQRLETDRGEPAFTEAPLDEQIAEICAELGLDPDKAARWRDLPEPDPDTILRHLGAAPTRRSSG